MRHKGTLFDMRQTLGHLSAVYWEHFKVWTAVQLQYRVAMVIWLLGLVLEPVIFLVVWVNVAQANGGAVGGYDRAGFAAYFIATMVVNHLCFNWHMWEYDYLIRQGKLSPRLLRPLHPIHADIAENLSYKTITLIVIIPTVAVLIWLFQPAWQPVPWSLLAFVPGVIMAFLIQFFLGWALAMAAFWTTRVNAINRMYFLGKLFFSGQIAPLTLLPPFLQTLASFLPFPWMIYFPVQLLLGTLSPQEAGQGLLVQLVWVVVGLTAVKLVWQAGVKRYAAFGA